jgi:hypothetical protein
VIAIKRAGPQTPYLFFTKAGIFVVKPGKSIWLVKNTSFLPEIGTSNPKETFVEKRTTETVDNLSTYGINDGKMFHWGERGRFLVKSHRFWAKMSEPVLFTKLYQTLPSRLPRWVK